MSTDMRRCRYNYVAHTANPDTEHIHLIGPLTTIRASKDGCLANVVQVQGTQYHTRPRWVILVLDYAEPAYDDLD